MAEPNLFSLAPWLRKRRSNRREVVDFDALVGNWAFHVPWAFRDALDIRHSYWVDEAATIQAQDAARTSGLDSVLVRKIRRYRGLWTQGDPPLYNFSDGDTLHHRAGTLLLQVLKAEGGQLTVLVYDGRTQLGVVSVTQNQFVEILQGTPVHLFLAAQNSTNK